MPLYIVHYKTPADDDGRRWGIGAFPNRDIALDVFNRYDAEKEGIGRFTFEEIGPFTDYILVEQGGLLVGPTNMYPLYNKL